VTNKLLASMICSTSIDLKPKPPTAGCAVIIHFGYVLRTLILGNRLRYKGCSIHPLQGREIKGAIYFSNGH